MEATLSLHRISVNVAKILRNSVEALDLLRIMETLRLLIMIFLADKGRQFHGAVTPNSLAQNLCLHYCSPVLQLQTTMVDVFTMGCVMYFVLTGGKHPFGDDPDEWNINIKKDIKRLTLTDQSM